MFPDSLWIRTLKSTFWNYAENTEWRKQQRLESRSVCHRISPVDVVNGQRTWWRGGAWTKQRPIPVIPLTEQISPWFDILWSVTQEKHSHQRRSPVRCKRVGSESHTNRSVCKVFCSEFIVHHVHSWKKITKLLHSSGVHTGHRSRVNWL